ncbi:MAG: HAD family hydrolase [Firmicutes bacterium]|nr:HAD family hydrolase [Bacillota bacterium]
MKKPKIEAVMVDLDNTVYPYEPCHKAGLESAGEFFFENWGGGFNFEQEYNDAREIVKSRTEGQAASHCRLLYFKEMTRKLFDKTDLLMAEQLSEAYWMGYFSMMNPDEDCPEVLELFREKNLKTAWVSNYTTGMQIKKLKKMGLESTLDYLVTSEESGAEKPNPAPFRLALSFLGTPPENTLMIGDSYTDDMEPAVALGMPAIWLNRKNKPTVNGVYSVGSWSDIDVLVCSFFYEPYLTA